MCISCISSRGEDHYYCTSQLSLVHSHLPGFVPTSVAQSDARPVRDQEFADRSLRSGNILFWRLIAKYFYNQYLTFTDSKKDICQFPAKEYAQVLVNRLED